MPIRRIYEIVNVFVQLVVRLLIDVNHVPGFVIREADIFTGGWARGTYGSPCVRDAAKGSCEVVVSA
jgi:hypothetical protein